jgi:hypothetical protein
MNHKYDEILRVLMCILQMSKVMIKDNESHGLNPDTNTQAFLLIKQATEILLAMVMEFDGAESNAPASQSTH